MIFYRQALFLIGMSIFMGTVVSIYWALVTGSIYICFCAIYNPNKEIIFHKCHLDIHEILNLLNGHICTVSLLGSNKKVIIEIDDDVDLQLKDYYIRNN